MFGEKAKKQKILHSKIRTVFGSPEGKEVLAHLMKEFNVFDSTFDSDPYIHAYNEGARSVMMRLLKTINTDPEQFSKLVKGQLEEDYDL